jgi:hypothetical protein
MMGTLSAKAGFRGGIIVIGTALLLAGVIALLVSERRETFSS